MRKIIAVVLAMLLSVFLVVGATSQQVSADPITIDEPEPIPAIPPLP